MKRRTSRRKRAVRYLRREAKARHLPAFGYAEVYGAVLPAYGTTRSAERRFWPYVSKSVPRHSHGPWQCHECWGITDD